MDSSCDSDGIDVPESPAATERRSPPCSLRPSLSTSQRTFFQVAVSRHPGKVAETHRLTRGELVRFFAERQPAVVLLEACGTAHFWARQLQQLGHRVLLLPPAHVRRYVTRNKTDQADAKALLEAHRNEEIRPVPVKSVAQQTLAALHRLRSAWIADRTARINLVRGVLRELGHPIPVGARHVVPQAWALLESAAASCRIRSGSPWRRPASRSATLKPVSKRSKNSSRLSPSRRPSSSACAPSRASGF